MTGDDVVRAFGGYEAVNGIIGMQGSRAVEQWKRIGVPFRHWPKLIRAAAERGIPGITFETLEATHAAAPLKQERAKARRRAKANGSQLATTGRQRKGAR